jgi:hypothetical protein
VRGIIFALPALLALAALGCSTSTQPIDRLAPAPARVTISGVVRYSTGAPAPFTRIVPLTAASDTTSADSLGNYSLSLPYSGDSVTVSLAQGDYRSGGVSIGTWYDWIKLLPNRSQKLNLVMRRFEPV